MGIQKTGDEHIVFDGMPTGYLLSDFWRWSSSDLLDNTLRGTYSEFIVAAALDLDLSTGFEDWLPWDLTYPFQWKDATGALHERLLHPVMGAKQAVQHHFQHPSHHEMGAGWTPLRRAAEAVRRVRFLPIHRDEPASG